MNKQDTASDVIETDKIMQKQSEREQIARQAFRNGYNCAQCMMVAFADVIGIDKESALRLSSAFGGGMGRLREVCGSVSGTFMVLGFLYGYDNPADYEAKKELYARVHLKTVKILKTCIYQHRLHRFQITF